MAFGLANAQEKIQMRSTNGPGGPEDGVTISVAWRNKALGRKESLETNFAEASGMGSVGEADKRASAECSPLQHFCPEPGTPGAAGVESWQPE